MKNRPRREDSCTGKKKLQAVEAKKIARAITERGDPVAPYRCVFCRGWHVGSHLGGRRFNTKPPRLRDYRDDDEEGRRYG